MRRCTNVDRIGARGRTNAAHGQENEWNDGRSDGWAGTRSRKNMKEWDVHGMVLWHTFGSSNEGSRACMCTQFAATKQVMFAMLTKMYYLHATKGGGSNAERGQPGERGHC